MLTHSSIPRTFAHCLAETCPQKSQCLRWKAYELLPGDLREQISFVNPKSVPPPQGEDCPYFMKMELQRYAKGMKRILDDVPFIQVNALRRQMINYFGRTAYYRCVNGERLITPKEQNDIKAMFSAQGLSDDLSFDGYIENYLFS